MAAGIKITETFNITCRDGAKFCVQQHTRYVTAKIAGVARETLGRTFYKTEDGRGVLKNPDNNTFSIPSLGITGANREN